MQLDRYDRKILEILQEDASIPASAVSEKVGLSQSQCWRRIERLQQDGVILRRTILVDRRKLGLNVLLFAQVKLAAHARHDLTDFAAAVQKFPEVLECYVLLGSVDYMLRIVAPNIEAYERFLFDKLSRLPMVASVNSMIAVSEMKYSTALPVGPAHAREKE